MKRGMNDAAVGSGRLVRESASPSLKLLYLGESSGTSRHRFEALRRLGHEVRLVEPRTAFFHNAWLGAWAFKTGSFGLEALIHNYVRREIGDDRFDVVWIDNGEFVGNALAKRLKAHAPVVLCHNLDNPFVARDGWRWRLLRDALPVYDLFVTPRVSSAQSAARAGARRTLRAVQSADEVAHLVTDSRKTASLDVVFVGSWMPERGPFLARLLERGVPLQIYGPNWHKAPEFANLSPVTTCGHHGDEAYAEILSRAKIALCLLSEGNQDLHTTRSLEIPSVGAMLCAPRTTDHLQMYHDGVEACFFNNAEQCASLCLELLGDDERRDAIGRRGHKRALANGHFNERLCRDVLAAALISRNAQIDG